ncbi:diacylglycerol kinase family protein [Piscinibacter sp. HJYY11]|uniref:diacylglycerol/lipid kinase family protein n=1 Tax=Piscinibacter sp. HJYY11 TaxID=2801333 RepID=UPI00191FB9B7|nr:diacylglycerol kinase family protein [Piscinibacter sp. HJYY11]MBL0728617.1 NAD(+)/NADH kinase [Piscinibacter sp. HJYY11]
MRHSSFHDSPLHVLLNAASGRDDAQATYALIGQRLAESGRRYRIEMVQRGADIPRTAQRLASQATAQGGVIVAAGGDGTINAVAQAAHDAGCPMGVLPQGTFNYFSRTHGIPQDTAAAVSALLNAQAQPVQVGLINNRVFLVNASLGLYPELLEDREAYKQRFGRSRIVALFAAGATLLREHRQLRLRIERGGAVRDVRTATLFVGNNRLQLQQVGLPEARGIEHGRVAAVMLKPTSTWGLVRLMWNSALGKLSEADEVESFQFQHMTVQPWLPYGARRVKVATDGEICLMRAPLEFRVSPRPLYLLKPGAVVTRTEAVEHAAAHL